jgi:hypothetical protein
MVAATAAAELAPASLNGSGQFVFRVTCDHELGLAKMIRTRRHGRK